MTTALVKQRIDAIDMMRGLVILLMLLDHVRERFYYHVQVSDPMDITVTEPGLFFSRFAAHFCAPVFVFLTGLSAWLYAHPAQGAPRSARGFLFKRGLFLIALEVTVITVSWMGSYHTVWLQVIWAIGVSMLVLAALLALPYRVLAVLGLLIVFGHNTLTPINFAPDEWGYSLWTILHDRNYLLQSDVLNIRASYPVLPWIGVILLGYVAGPLYAMAATKRRCWLLSLGTACLLLLVVLRGFNIYGETLPWQLQATATASLMAILNFTKYPPSLHFLLVTLGLMFLLLAYMERWQSKAAQVLVTFGSVPMFFYILHLYVLLALYSICMAVFGPNQGVLFGVNQLSLIWLISIVLAVLLYWPTKWFSQYKHSSKKAWLRYL